jgi:putative Holliday junction resolvase
VTPGSVLGIDPGGRRVGVAVADLETRFARPLEVIDARDHDPIERIAEIAREREAVSIVVGKPLGLSGHEGPAVREQRDFMDRLRARVDVEVVEFDERMTSVVAERDLRAAGGKPAARKAVRDAVAAQVILQGYLDAAGTS